MSQRFKTKFKYGVLFAAIVIFIYACFMNFGSVIRFFGWMLQIIMPLIIGCMLAVVLNVPMKGLHHLISLIPKKLGKKVNENVINAISLVLTLICTFLVIFLVFSVVVPQLVSSVKSIGETFKNYYPTLIETLKKYNIDTKTIDEFMTLLHIDELISKITENVSTIITTTFSAASSIFNTVFNVFTGFIIAVYLLASKKKLGRQAKKMLYAYIKKSVADKIYYVAILSSRTFTNFFSGQCLEAVILGLLFFISMTIFGFPYASVISLFIGFMALIPYVGAFLGMLLGCLLIVMVDPMKAVLFAVLFLVIQQVEGQLIYPRVVGTSVGLPAIWTMLAALVGGALFNVVGMLFFIPLTSVIYSLLRDNVNSRLKQKNIQIND